MQQQKKRKIVFINQATGYLTIDVINAFAGQFKQVALITGSIRIQDKPLNEKVRVSKIVRYDRGSNLRKAFSWLIGTCQIMYLLVFRYRNFEKFYYTIPPTGYLLARRAKPLYSITVFDLYPDALKVFGISESNLIFRWWEKQNSRIFKNAHRIYTLSDRMKSRILELSPGCNVRVIPNWSAFSGYVPVKKDLNIFRKQEGLNNKFVVQYSGNIGVTHKVEVLIELAEKLMGQDDIQFLIIGRGERSKTITELINKKGLSNCKILPYRKDEELFESLCTANLAVVTLDDTTPDVSVPSKVYNILSAGVPIMAVAKLSSSVAEIIHSHNIGKTFEKDQLESMADYINKIKSDINLYKQLSNNALLASKKFTDANAYKYLEAYMK